ncbi:MAG TPA: serine hydrolase domain-containing protein [Ferruginibacter sp.]|nr:serine hydrolase domain-containing protein [Ferruginibacter sp.]HMP20364.1 serine hydrolase domain-containing protein [Ferruginibacter sp.]
MHPLISGQLSAVKKTFFFLYGISGILLLLGSASCFSKHNTTAAATDSTLIQLPAPAPLMDGENEKLHQGCSNWYEAELKNSGFNGGLLVAKKGNIIFEQYKGTASVNGTDTINSNTAFHIASVSKTFTATAILKLWQEGRLQIDDELAQYFPAFNFKGVTIRHLLNHRSGLPNYVYFMEEAGWNKKQYLSNKDVLDILTTQPSTLKNIGTPGRSFSYCNTNYALLALLIEKITGKTYAAYLQETFFTPLQMKNSFVFDTTMIGQVTCSYDWRGALIPFNFLDAVYGDKNIYSTPRDLLVWDRALSSKKILTDSILLQAYTPYSNEKPGIRNYGLGWRMNIYPSGKKMIYHNGWWHGNNASFIRLLDEDATIIAVGNRFTRTVYHVKDLVNLFANYYVADEEE